MTSSSSSSSSSSFFEMIVNPFQLLNIFPVHPRELRHLNVGNNRLGQTGSHLVATILKNMETFPNLGKLTMSDAFLPRTGSEAIAIGLSANTTLHTLRIKQVHDNTSDGVVAIFRALAETRNIAHLTLHGSRFNNESFQALQTALNTNPSIRSLTINGCHTSDPRNDICHFMRAPHLQSLTISYYSFFENSYAEDVTISILAANTTLQSLVLNRCNLADSHAISFAKVFSSGITPLTRFEASHNKIGPVGVQHLVDALATNTLLTVLNLGTLCGSELVPGHSQASWNHFERLLTCNTTLQSINISNHSNSQPPHLIYLEPTFTIAPPLTTFNVSFTFFDDSTMQRLLKVLPESLTTLDLTGCLPIQEGAPDPSIFMENIVGLLNNYTALTELSFGGPALLDMDLWDQYDADLEMPLAGALKNNTLLRTLKMLNVNLHEEVTAELCKALAENSTLETFEFTFPFDPYRGEVILSGITNIFETYLPLNGSLTDVEFDKSYECGPIEEMLKRNERNMALKTGSLFKTLLRLANFHDWMRPDDGMKFDRSKAKRTRTL